MERINEIDGIHHLEIFDRHLVITKQEVGYKKQMMLWKRRSHGKDIRHRTHKTVMYYHEKPVSLSFFTLRQLSVIVLEVSQNYLRETHLFCFGIDRYIVRVLTEEQYENESSEPKIFLSRTSQ